MFYLHTMVRISNVDDSLKFYCDFLGMKLEENFLGDEEKKRIFHRTFNNPSQVSHLIVQNKKDGRVQFETKIYE